MGWGGGWRSSIRVRCPHPASYVGWVCCWFSSLLREIFLRVLRFFPLLKNQHFQIPIRSWWCPQLAFCPKYRWHLNNVIYFIYFLFVFFPPLSPYRMLESQYSVTPTFSSVSLTFCRHAFIYMWGEKANGDLNFLIWGKNAITNRSPRFYTFINDRDW